MKKILMSAAVATVFFANAQKKEIANAYKAIESNDLATAASQIAAAEVAMGGKTTMLEPSTLEQYYYTKGLMLLRSGKNAEGASYLAKISDLGKTKIYSGKDASRNKVYYVGKTEADASGLLGLKEESYTPTTVSKLGAIINPLISKANNSAIDAYNNKRYEEAGDRFLEVYNLLKSGGQINNQMLYNAGLSYAYANKGSRAIDVFGNLINSGYTGVETTYTAKNKKSGEMESFDKNTWELMKKNPEYSDFKTETSPSVEQQIYETNAALLITENRLDEAITFIDRGLQKFPNNAKLGELKGNALYKSGKTSEFVKSLKDQLAKNPNDAVNWYNLGVLQSKDAATTVEAEASFKKAVELNPNMANAYQNLTVLMMGDDSAAVQEIETARKSGNTSLHNKLLQERRNRFAKALPYAEKWYALDRDNIDAVTILKGLYNSGKNEVKYQEMKAREAELLKK